MLDNEVIGKFKEFQQKTGKYLDLVIDDVRFEKISLSDNKYFAITMGQSPKGESLNKISNGIPFYQGKTDFGKESLRKPTTWTSKSKKEAKVDDILITLRAPAGVVNFANINLSIGRGLSSIRCFNNIEKLYIFYFLKNNENKINVENDKGGFFSSMTKDYLYSIQVPIPKNLNDKYTSLELQKIIVEFLEHGFDWLDGIKANIDKQYGVYTRLRKSLIPSTFKKDYIKVRFAKYAKKYNIDFDITDVEFEIKRINADKKDEADVICKKRMGFTPDRDVYGDINWFLVKDLGKTSELFINNPNTNEKTTMKLIKEKVDKNNTGKSEKLIPIKKGNILISFKLTVGVVKVYNSDEPAYCNEAIDILTVNDDINSEYIAYNCILEYPKYGTRTNNGVTLNDDHKKLIKIFIPKPLDKYTSYQIQKIIADFINEVGDEIKQAFDKIGKGYDAVKRYKRAYLYKTFSKIDWSK